MENIKRFCDKQYTCKKEIYSFTAKEPLAHLQWVMRCPDDKNKVIGWDGVDAECRIGYVKCPLALPDCPDLWLQPGDCVDVVICYDFGGREMGCKASGWVCDEAGNIIWFEKGKDGIKYYCDPTGTEEVVPVGKLKPAGPEQEAKGKDGELVTGWVCDEDENPYYFVKTLCFDAETGETTHELKYYTTYDCAEEVTFEPGTKLKPYNPVQIDETKEQVLSTIKVDTPPGEAIKLGVPRGAVGAEIYFDGNPCCEWQATWDGSDPTNGPKFCPGDAIFLGCTKESESIAGEVSSFCVIALDDCKEACLSVTFYAEPVRQTSFD